MKLTDTLGAKYFSSILARKKTRQLALGFCLPFESLDISHQHDLVHLVEGTFKHRLHLGVEMSNYVIDLHSQPVR